MANRTISGKEVDNIMTNIMRAQSNPNLMNYNMRLFGVPHQFTQYTDYRLFQADVDNNTSMHKKIGRKFMENIMMEAPILTVIPGKPTYLPAAKDKRSITAQLLSSTNEGVSSVLSSSIAQEAKVPEKLRYYDFQSDYIRYMQYVNILCATAASFLDLNNPIYDIDDSGGSLAAYDWKNYRYTANRYSMAAERMFSSDSNLANGFVSALKTFGADTANAFYEGTGLGGSATKVNAFQSTADDDSIEALESLLAQMNFVQFFIDPSSGVSESASNRADQSKIAQQLQSGEELFQEIAFLANSSGIDATQYQSYMSGATDALTEKLTQNNSTMSGILGRLLGAGSSLIKGDKMIFPEIYRSSEYSKTYNVKINLMTPYGDKLSYFLNVLVPLFHLIGLTIPKQTTANTYGAPFLIRASYPGVFSCNMGIVEQISIEKAATEDGWTVDGFPNHIEVGLSIRDLYSDLTLTPAGDPLLFIANSSLVEYIAVNCGIDMARPRLSNRVKAVVANASQIKNTVRDAVEQEIWNALDGRIESLIYH